MGETKRICLTYEEANVVTFFYKKWIIIVIGQSDSNLGKQLVM